jgi:hypothetical protein
LLGAIARVNAGTTELSNARIKKINEFTFRGGNPADLDTRRSGAATTENAAPVREFGTITDPGGSSSTTGYKAPGKFDADDVFGSGGGAAAARKAAGGPPVVGGDPGLRWVESSAGKWRSRGFVLRLVMDQREIPRLVAELSDSPFPIEVKHIDYPDYDPQQDANFLSKLVVGPGGAAARGADVEAEQRIRSMISISFNQSFLAEIIVAGLFTIYDEPEGVAAPAAPTPPSTGAAPAAATKATATTPPPGAPAATANGAATGGKPSVPPKPATGGPTASPPGAAATQPPAGGKPVEATPKNSAPSASNSPATPGPVTGSPASPASVAPQRTNTGQGPAK